MLRWCSGIGRLGHITDDAVKLVMEVALVKDKLQERSAGLDKP